MVRTLSAALLAGAAGALGLAAPAAADEAGYLKLQDRFAFLTADQLLSTGYQVCQASRSGMVAPDIVDMVSRDLGAGLASATEIVASAIIQLDC
ncbi:MULTISPECIES: DUF732 domain-containing protein [Mycobacteriaceae]|uniref:DUF732 domain-containing protein n=1 Tax=Mycobacteriaceae TaxID=1762 RepID=UPI0007FF1354|nr:MULTISPECIES: DUF732 domain-containing protein [Mycobacteriaceae]MCK0173497.1 DUF732 domain-containing protein [Mycolicibacterium sp. F2034L]OBB56163.1 hypothetical protein A5757_03860 [Mycobacterium sp. 852013-51886_SCH5428379]